jgi:hypothetical protein
LARGAEPGVALYGATVKQRYFRGEIAFAKPEIASSSLKRPVG